MIQRQHRPNAVTTTRGSSKLKTFVHFMQFFGSLENKSMPYNKTVFSRHVVAENAHDYYRGNVLIR